MPKEVIRPSVPRDNTFDQPFDVQVGWAADRDVQIGVETCDGKSLLSQLYGDPDALETIAVTVGQRFARFRGMDSTQVRDLLDAIEASQVNVSGLWASMDRHQINRLIATLRKARNSAYGRDE